ncbi:hypothetical protein TNCV_1273581 [Trichonephila clavipes]|nr:hypothetical protein TNCV_1273581 [Trichonephila clavipes]
MSDIWFSCTQIKSGFGKPRILAPLQCGMYVMPLVTEMTLELAPHSLNSPSPSQHEDFQLRQIFHASAIPQGRSSTAPGIKLRCPHPRVHDNNHSAITVIRLYYKLKELKRTFYEHHTTNNNVKRGMLHSAKKQ